MTPAERRLNLFAIRRDVSSTAGDELSYGSVVLLVVVTIGIRHRWRRPQTCTEATAAPWGPSCSASTPSSSAMETRPRTPRSPPGWASTSKRSLHKRRGSDRSRWRFQGRLTAGSPALSNCPSLGVEASEDGSYAEDNGAGYDQQGARENPVAHRLALPQCYPRADDRSQ